MKIGTFFWVKTRNLILLSTIVSFIAFIINAFSDNWLLSKFVNIQEYQTIKSHTCNKIFTIENDALILKDFTFEKGDGSCVKELNQKSINKLVIDDVHGGDTIETRVFAKYIKSKKIPALIKGHCNSSCVDLFLHSPDRSFCVNSGEIGIHSFRNEKHEENRFIKWLRISTQDAMLRAHYKTNINIDFIKEIYSVTPNTELYNLKLHEIKENNFAHRFVTCK